MRLKRFSTALLLGLLHGLVPGADAAQLEDQEPEWYLPVGGGCRLFVQEYGAGRDTILVLHGGWGAEHSYLLDAFRGLDRDYHIVFYDQRGSLRSPCPDSLISAAGHIDDLDGLRSELGLERITLVGHSMGTYLAMSYLQRYGDRVRGLVLMGALLPKSAATPEEQRLAGEGEQAARAFFERPEVLAELRRHGLDRDTSALSAQEETSAWRVRFAGVNLYHVERWQALRGGQVFYSSRAGNAAGRTMPSSYDFTRAIAAHGCPVWVLHGDHDYVDMGAKRHQRWSQGIANVRLRVLADAGHAAWIDAPEQFQSLLREALRSTSACQ